MAKDLHTWLAEYEAAYPEDVVRIQQEVDSRYISTAIVDALDRRGRYPLLLFERLRLPDGTPSAFPMVTNLFASRVRCARLFDGDPRFLGDVFHERADADIDPVVISDREAPVRDVAYTGEEIDLTRFPALVHHELDPGPYLTAGFFTCYHPENWIENSALHRAWVRGPRELRAMLSPNQHAKKNLLAHERLNRPMQVAFWQGHHPLAVLGSQVKRGYPGSHYAAMGGLLGEPLRLVPSLTLGDNFLLPADAEWVVEGEMTPGERVPEGPFGEFTGYTGPQEASTPAFRVTAVYHRRQMYWHDIQVGYADNRVMGGVALEGGLYELLKARIPSLKNVYMPVSGLCRYHAYVQLHEPPAGEAREAIICALSMLKHVFVFDSDVDIFDEDQVLRAVATHSQWDRDTIVLPRMRGGRLDPSAPHLLNCKAGIDCTRPKGRIYVERDKVPADVLARIRPEDFLA